eukprot:gene21811-27754_t
MTQDQQRGYLGEKLFLRVKEMGEGDNAAKITGMILEAMDNAEVINLLDSPQLMRGKVHEAVQ